MAKRTIKTDVKLDGEKEYKQALSNINSGLRVLNSEMKLTSAQYSENAGGVDALTKKNDVLNRQILSQKDKVDMLRAALQNSAEKYGESDKKTGDWKISLNNAERELIGLEKELKDNDKALKKATESTEKHTESTKKTGDESKKLGTVIDGLANKLGINLPSGLTKSMDGLGAVSGKALVAVGAFAAVVAAVVKVEKALIKMTKEAAKSADEIMTLSMTSGMTTDAIQEFQYASELLDVSLETLTGSQTKMIRSMSSAQEGAASSVEAWEKLGVSIYGADGNLRDTQETFYAAIDALGQVQNETERDALAMEIFGKSARELNPLIIQGSGALAEFSKEARENNNVMSGETLRALGAVDDAYQRLQNSQKSITQQLAGEFAPYMTKVLTDCKEFIEKIGKALKDSGAVSAFGSILDSVSSLLEPLGSLISSVLPGLMLALNPIADVIALIADTINAIVGMLPSNWGSGMFSTAMGWNVSKGQLSNQQKRYYADQMDSQVWDPTLKAWVSKSWANQKSGYNASGTDNWRGGVTWVGENGPEKVYLPQGSQISTAQESRTSGGDIFNITIDAKNVQEFNDIVRISKSQRRMTRMGYAGG